MKKLFIGSAAVLVALAGMVMLVALFADTGSDSPSKVKRIEVFEDQGIAQATDDSGDAEKLGIKGTIAYVIRDADGNIKEDVIIHNTTMPSLLNAAATRLVLGTTTAANTMFDDIQLCSDNGSGLACTVIDITQEGGSYPNPATTTATGPAGVDDGIGTFQAQNTFTCTQDAGCTAIEEIQLAAGDGVSGVAGSPVGAWQNVSMTLNDNDTVQITWTVDID